MSKAAGGPLPKARPRGLLRFLVPVSFSGFATVAVYIASGPTLGLVIGGLAVVTLLAGSAGVPSRHGRVELLLPLPGIIIPPAFALLVVSIRSGWGFLPWLSMIAVLISHGIGVVGVSMLLERFRVPGTLTIPPALLWLSWPFWLAPWLSGGESEGLVNALVKPHPVFAVNGSMPEVFPVPWAQHRIAYRLTNIGDDIPYEMPATIAWCVVVHLAVGLGALALSHSRRVKADSPGRPPGD